MHDQPLKNQKKNHVAKKRRSSSPNQQDLVMYQRLVCLIQGRQLLTLWTKTPLLTLIHQCPLKSSKLFLILIMRACLTRRRQAHYNERPGMELSRVRES